MIYITNLNWIYISSNPSIASRKQHFAASDLRKQPIMTSFVHVDHPTEHPGVVRAERVFQSAKALASGFDSARAGATLLLAAVVAALLLVANQVVDTWTDGRLLAAWIVMWTVGFAALALLAAPAARAANALAAAVKEWNEAGRQAHEDQKYWEVALSDPRVMADISRAMSGQGGTRR